MLMRQIQHDDLPVVLVLLGSSCGAVLSHVCVMGVTVVVPDMCRRNKVDCRLPLCLEFGLVWFGWKYHDSV